jgi:hypothetical protein
MAQKKKRTVETCESYPVRIIDWKVDYSLRLDKDGSISGVHFGSIVALSCKVNF